MTNATLQWLVPLIVTAVVIPLATALWRERERRFAAEQKLAIYEDEVPKAIKELRAATAGQTRPPRSRPYRSLQRSRTRSASPPRRSRS